MAEMLMQKMESLDISWIRVSSYSSPSTTTSTCSTSRSSRLVVEGEEELETRIQLQSLYTFYLVYKKFFTRNLPKLGLMGSYYMGEVCSNGFTAHKL